MKNGTSPHSLTSRKLFVCGTSNKIQVNDLIIGKQRKQKLSKKDYLGTGD
jgi:hypothetical protein